MILLSADDKNKFIKYPLNIDNFKALGSLPNPPFTRLDSCIDIPTPEENFTLDLDYFVSTANTVFPKEFNRKSQDKLISDFVTKNIACYLPDGFFIGRKNERFDYMFRDHNQHLVNVKITPVIVLIRQHAFADEVTLKRIQNWSKYNIHCFNNTEKLFVDW
jgi:hypothetical protein